MKKIARILLAAPIVLLPTISKAFCPVCTIAISAGLGLSRYLKIDDSLSGVWVGALLMSSSLWFANYLKKKKKNTLWSIPFAIFLYASTFIPLHYYNITGHPNNQLLGMDKLIFGSIVGTVIFPFTAMIHKKLKKDNGGKSYFPFQSVAVPVVILLLVDLAIYVIIK